MKKFKLNDKPKNVMTGMVQRVQKTVKLPPMNPAVEVNDDFFIPVAFSFKRVKIVAANRPVKMLIIVLKITFSVVKPAPMTHIKSLEPGKLAIM